MDYIYLDTSIFESNNFLESKRINEILKLSEEKHIRIVLPIITYTETQIRAVKNIKEASARFRKYREESRILRNVESIKNKFEIFDQEACIKEFLTTFDSRLKQARCIIIDYQTINIKNVFEKYFGDVFPFSKGEKKHEFPDAFALLSVETWCIEKRRKCYVFSNDKDLLNYKSDSLIIVSSYEKYLDDKLRKIEVEKKRQNRIDLITKRYEEEKKNLEKEISDWVFNGLDDMRIYYRHINQEVHNVKIKDINVTLTDFQIVSINETEIQLEAKAEIYFCVEVEIDDEDSGYYDSEDKVFVYLDTKFEIIEENQVIPIQMKATIPAAGEEYIDVEINEINEGKDFRLRSSI